jgi:hypothetical protein
MKDLGGWICDENYQIYSPVLPQRFSLYVYDREPMLCAYAVEITRISIAAFETLNERRLDKNSRSIGWFLIERYYAAFFAAHAVMRMMGSGCGPVGRLQGLSVIRVANLWAAPAPSSYSAGLHKFRFDNISSTFFADSISGSPHESFWRLFDSALNDISVAVLSSKVNLSLDTLSRQAVSNKLDQLRQNLSYLSSGNAIWLTAVRNSINYDHKFAAWYPYEGRQKYYRELYKHSDSWKKDSMEIELSSYEGEDLMRFQATCNFILAICRETIEEMSRRCSSGQSFHQSGALAYFNLAHRAAKPSAVHVAAPTSNPAWAH